MNQQKKTDKKLNEINMKVVKYVLQDVKKVFPQINGLSFSLLSRYIRIPAVRILISYRLCQYAKKNKWRGAIFIVLRLRHIILCNRYTITLDDTLEAGSGLYFPHNGPFVINGAAKIGENCIIHPNVLIGGDRSKGKSPVIGNNVFIGNGAKIIGDSTIGDWCFITPGAIITKDVPSGAVVGAGLNNIISMNGKTNYELYKVL